MFNFKRLLKKYTRTLPQLKIIGESYRDYSKGGILVTGEISFEEFEGVILPLGENVIFDNSAYTTDDKKLYTYADIKENQIIKYKEREYTTMEYKGYEDYDEDLKIFILKSGGKNVRN